MASAADAKPVPPGIQAAPPVLAMFARYGPAYRWWATITVMLGSFATLLSATIINVAVPDIMGALGMSAAEAQWLSTGFLAMSTITMLVSAWAVETLGVVRTYLIAMAVFAAGGLLGGMAPTGDALILARVVQGAGAGLISPVSMLIIFQVFPLHRRGTAMGIYSVGIILAPALGPAFGGALIDHFSWRYVFLLAIPFVMAAVPLALMFLPGRDAQQRKPAFDWTGAGLLSVWLLSVLVLLSNGSNYGWDSPTVAWLLFGAVTSGIGFLYWQTWVQDPLLNVRLFLNGKFLAAAIVTFALGLGLFGSTYVLPLFLQTVQLLSPSTSGLLLVPAGLLMAAVFPIAGRLSDSIAPRNLILAGVLVFALSSLLFKAVDAATPIATLIVWVALGRMGLALIFPCLNAAALRPLALQELAQGSAAINFLRQLGGAFGVNLLTIYLVQRTELHADAIMATQTAGNPATVQLAELLLPRLYQTLGLSGRLAELMAQHHLGSQLWQQASMLAYRDTFVLVGALFLLCLIPAWFMDKRPPNR